MNESMMFNLNSYLNKKSSDKNGLCIFLVLSLSLIFLFCVFYKVEERIEINAQTICETDACIISFYKKIEENIPDDFITIKNQTYEIENISLEEIELDNTNEAYQKTTLKIKEYQGRNNEIVTLKFIKQKVNFITKIYKIIKER